MSACNSSIWAVKLGKAQRGNAGSKNSKQCPLYEEKHSTFEKAPCAAIHVSEPTAMLYFHKHRPGVTYNPSRIPIPGRKKGEQLQVLPQFICYEALPALYNGRMH